MSRAPLSVEDTFAAAMAPVSDAKRLAIALSGGPDSTALLHLAHGWAAPNRVRLNALVVDHGLRADSAAEAQLVAQRAHDLGVACEILVWQDPDASSGVQAAAREARYRLMLDWCRDAGCSALLLGHHADDQAATVLMRLRHGSGLDGLGAMAPIAIRDRIQLVRPLLDLPKQTLIDWLSARGLPFVIDPTNASPKYERNRLNSWFEANDRDRGLTLRLNRLAARSRRASAALQWMTELARQDVTTTQSETCICFDQTLWQNQPEEIRIRLVSGAIDSLTGTKPSLGGVEAALERLPAQRRLTVGGAVMTLTATRLEIEPAPPRRTG